MAPEDGQLRWTLGQILTDVEAMTNGGAVPRAGDAVVWSPRRRNRAADLMAGLALEEGRSACWLAPEGAWRKIAEAAEVRWVAVADAGKKDSDSSLGWVIAELCSQQILVATGTYVQATCASREDINVLEALRIAQCLR